VKTFETLAKSLKIRAKTAPNVLWKNGVKRVQNHMKTFFGSSSENIRTKSGPKRVWACLGKFGQKSFPPPKYCLLLHLCSERQCAPPFELSFSFSLLAVCLKVLMLECLHFSHTTGSLHYDGWWMTLQFGFCQSVLLLSMLVVCKHRFCNNALMYAEPSPEDLQ